MNTTLFLSIVKSEQQLLSVRAERGRQRAEAIRAHARREGGVPASLRQHLQALVHPRPRGTLGTVMVATPRGTRGPVVLNGAAGR